MRTYFIFFTFFICSNLPAQLFINEVCSDNENVLVDEEGDFEDWLEIFNSGNTTINLQNYWLSDDDEILNKWRFPDIEIPANAYLLVFASGKDFIGDQVHTNFKISKDGETITLSDPNLNVLDQLTVPALEMDQAYGRQPDGTNNFRFLLDPSPEQSNNASSSFGFSNPPFFLNTSFFSSTPSTVTINCNQPGCQIYYTTDGSIPDDTDFPYTEPIIIDTTTTIRATSIAPDFFMSEPSTRTFFVNEDHRIPIMCISTEPENLWNWDYGIFVKGPNADSVSPFLGANFWSDTIIPVHMEYFIEEQLAVEYPLAAKVHGGSGARTKPMKPLRLMAKSAYGTALMDYPFFENRTNTKFERLVLRNSSGDFNIAHMRDEFLARYFINEKLFTNGVSEQPIVVYLNGAYYGVMHLREKIDKFHLQYNYDIDPENIDLLEEDTAIIEGNFNTFEEHENFIINNDLADETNFEIAAGYFDLENLSDYVIVQTFVNNTDWPNNNLKYWRPKVEGAKWKYLLFDMDVSTAVAGFTKASEDSFGRKMLREDVRMIVIFKAFLENENFRNYFINRYADLSNSSLREERFHMEVIRSRDEIDHDMKQHLPRWGKTYDTWYNTQVPRIETFTLERAPYARQFIMEYFQLPSQDQILVNTYPENAGDIQINTLSIPNEELPWDGYYFNTVPIKLSVSPQAGFNFSHWESSCSASIISSNLTCTVQPHQGETFTAVFENNLEEFSIDLFPNPASDQVQIKLTSPELKEVQIKVFNAVGKLILPQFNQNLNTGDNFILLNLSDLDEGTYIIQILGEGISESKKLVRFFNTN